MTLKEKYKQEIGKSPFVLDKKVELGKTLFIPTVMFCGLKIK